MNADRDGSIRLLPDQTARRIDDVRLAEAKKKARAKAQAPAALRLGTEEAGEGLRRRHEGFKSEHGTCSLPDPPDNPAGPELGYECQLTRLSRWNFAVL